MRTLGVSIAASIDKPWQWKLFFDEGGGVVPLLECIRDGARSVEKGRADGDIEGEEWDTIYDALFQKKMFHTVDVWPLIEECKTNVKAYNITLVNTVDNNQGLIKEALYVSKEANFTMTNSVVYGFRDFLMLDKFSMTSEFEKYIKLKDLVVGHCENTFSSLDQEETLRMDVDFIASKNNIAIADGAINDYFKSTDFSITPDFRYLKIDNNISKVVLNNK